MTAANDVPVLVDFMMIGAQKCGTTTLARQLAAHPQICFSRIKEPGYFNCTTNWKAELGEYHGLFDPEPGQICGEASTMYTFLPEYQDTHSRLYAYNPDLKLIYVMRHPVERVISNYAHRVVRDTVAEIPERAIFARPEYINRSRYGVQLRPYLQLFGRDNLLLVIFDEYLSDSMATLAQIATFLNIDVKPFAEILAHPTVAHSSVGEYHLKPSLQRVRDLAVVDAVVSYLPASVRKTAQGAIGKKLDRKPSFSPELRQLLWQFLEDDVASVETLMGRRLSIWRKGYRE